MASKWTSFASRWLKPSLPTSYKGYIARPLLAGYYGCMSIGSASLKLDGVMWLAASITNPILWPIGLGVALFPYISGIGTIGTVFGMRMFYYLPAIHLGIFMFISPNWFISAHRKSFPFIFSKMDIDWDRLTNPPIRECTGNMMHMEENGDRVWTWYYQTKNEDGSWGEKETVAQVRFPKDFPPENIDHSGFRNDFYDRYIDKYGVVDNRDEYDVAARGIYHL